MQKKRVVYKRILLFLVIFGLPFAMIYFFALGKPHYSKLPYLTQEGLVQKKETDNFSPYKVSEFHFYDKDGKEITKKELGDKIILASVLYDECPTECPLNLKMFKQIVFDEVIHLGHLKDVVIVSQVVNRHGEEPDIDYFSDDLGITSPRWYFVKTDTNAFYNHKLQGKWLNNTPDPEYPDRLAHHRIILLIDKEGHIREMYDGMKETDYKKILDELWLLSKEYQ